MSDTSFRTDRAGKEHRPGWPPAGEAPSGEENFRATRKFEPQPSGAAKLRIKVGQCGAELPRTDAVGEPDPYVRVTVGPCSAVTEVKAEEASQPAWDQALELQVDLATPLPLMVEIIDRDATPGGADDDLLASGVVDLRDVVPLWNGTALADGAAALADGEEEGSKVATLASSHDAEAAVPLTLSVEFVGQESSAFLASPSPFAWLGDPTKFESIWRDRDQLLEEFFEIAKAQSEAFESELAACTMIQRVWRGTSCRLRLFERSFAVLTIQRIARGFAGRLEYAQRLIVAQRLARMAYYDGNATRIQKCWRGCYSRKTKHDYYARQLFLQAIANKNDEMRSTLADHYEQQVEDVRQRTFEEARTDFERLISDKHHLVSTVGIPGVFNSPFPGMQPTAFGEYVDDHLRRTVDGLTQRTLPSMRSTGHSARYSQGKLSPGSLQATGPYDAVEQTNRAERRVSNAVRSRVSPSDFKPTKAEYPVLNPPSVHVGPQIVEPHKVLERPDSSGAGAAGVEHPKAFTTAGGQGVLFDDVAAN
eukprot:COSAG04_NODE_1597_length_6202_cov_14.561527_2_plen_535_part_00